MIFGRTAFFAYFITPGGETWWFSNLPRPQEPTRQELAATSPAEWLAEVSASHAGDPPVVSAILRSSLPPVGAWPMTDLASIPTWHTDRVCLLGDAAHATSPSAGQGASLAIEDAIVLGHHIAHSGPTATAFAAFEADRRDRVESLIQTARRNGSNKAPGPIGGLIRDLLLPVFLHRGKRETVRAYGYRAPELVR